MAGWRRGSLPGSCPGDTCSNQVPAPTGFVSFRNKNCTAREDGFCKFQLPPADSLDFCRIKSDMWPCHLYAHYK